MPEQSLKNRLAETTSPYLLQHANNPVAWQPWDDKALSAARELNRPILLSSGYSSCHWCHVMAHESFEDEETAALMNASFVNIKLDREKRPDLDMVYQTAHGLLSQRSGGWPLTVFLSAQTLQPFFCGTYFPKEPRHNLPSFKDVLRAVAQHYHNDRQAVTQIGEQVQTALQDIYTLERETVPLPEDLPQRACNQLLHAIDRVNGGFGGAPKFPQPGLLHCLLRRHDNDAPNRQMISNALQTSFASICRRGLYDHVGGGFFRYCVDAEWGIPHFEKMLYDNGQLLGLLADARRLFDDEHLADAAVATAQWMEREMQSNDGGYYCALDADSPDGEGDYYVWQRSEIEEVIGERAASDLAHGLGMPEAPNFEGRWHLNMRRAAPEGRDAAQFNEEIKRHLETLQQHRAARTPPGVDNKHLTAWNALTIKGMAKTARAFDYAPALASAERALNFIRCSLWRDEQLHGGVCQGRVHEKVFLSDYAFLIDAVLEMLQHRWSSDDLLWAIQLTEQLLAQFEDTEHGGYYFTPHTSQSHDASLQRPVTFYDEAVPSGYGVATLVLARLGYLCGETRYVASAEKALDRASSVLAKSPAECASLLYAFEERLRPPTMVIIRTDDELEAWRAAAMAQYNPHRLAFVIPSDAPQLPEAIAVYSAKPGGVAYVCSGTSCSEPITDPRSLTVSADEKPA